MITEKLFYHLFCFENLNCIKKYSIKINLKENNDTEIQNWHSTGLMLSHKEKDI